MKKILILTTYNDILTTKQPEGTAQATAVTMDVARVKELLVEAGFTVGISSFATLDISAVEAGTYVLYASSEDEGKFYKQYIEDALLALLGRGAVLLPEFKWFRAHGNKVFQERLRASFSDEKLQEPAGIGIGHVRELDRVIGNVMYPAVIKSSGGAGSRGVVRADSERALWREVSRLMRHTYYDFGYTRGLRFGLFVKRLLRRITGKRVGDETVFRSAQTNAVVIQPLIEGLDGDYKVLYFYGKYFVLSRKNRDNDFRASGSGKFTFPERAEEVRDVLDFARSAVKEIDTPMMSLDIGRTDTRCYLIEFQCVYFGTYTLQFAPCCFVPEGENWIRREGKHILEEEYAGAILKYINRH
ncbi:MAG: hypothetical protein IJR00_03190 [Lachnospiraceae bacterium]|nr:hypothetical protein [Lachnospiraceae bacterium]